MMPASADFLSLIARVCKLVYNKQLMTGPKANRTVSFVPETLNVEVEGKQNSLFPEGAVFKCLLYFPTQK